MITVFVGDVTPEVQIAACSEDSRAILVTNRSQVISPGVYYTAIGDLQSIEELISILAASDKIVYVPVECWSDSGYSKLQYYTEFYVRMFMSSKEVIGLDHNPEINNMLSLVDQRKSKGPQLWVAGCSVSHGIGVSDNEKYGQLVATQLGMSVSFLTRAGSSIVWQADQILRSDIQPGDIVIWGLTEASRVSWYHNKQLYHINSYIDKVNPELTQTYNLTRLVEDDLYYRAVTQIYQVINFCNKVSAKLYFAGVLVSPEFLNYLTSVPNYVHLNNAGTETLKDVGTDGCHPGPLTHQWYAGKILDLIKGKQ